MVVGGWGVFIGWVTWEVNSVEGFIMGKEKSIEGGTGFFSIV